MVFAKQQENHMTTLSEIEKAVGNLRDQDYSEFRRWFLEHDWNKWDAQIASDSAAGELDFLIKEAADAKTKGTLKNL